MIQYVSRSTEDTEALGRRLAAVLKDNSIVALFGDLGAGKTALTRGICDGLDVSDGVSSPTFAIVNAYLGRVPIYHFDMYRITSLDDLFSTGYYDYIGNGILIIEWSENIESELEPDAIRIRIIKNKNENEREFLIEGLDEYADIIC